MEFKSNDLAQHTRIIALRNKLKALDDVAFIEPVFLAYIEKGGIREIVSDTILEIAIDSNYRSSNIRGKYYLQVFEDERFSYAVQLLIPGDEPRYPKIWTGDQQVIAVQGNGCVKIKTWELPSNLDIDHFELGCKLTLVEEKTVKNQEIISNWKRNRILEIFAVDNPVILEVLLIKNPKTQLNWTFDTDLRANGIAPAKSFLARLKIIMDLAIEMEEDIPQTIYDTVLNFDNSSIKFRAIEAMLLENHPDAEEHFQCALNSKSLILSNLAKDLYFKLIGNN